MAAPGFERTDPSARLVDSADVDSAINQFHRVFAELTDHLRVSPTERIESRLRSWDNYQRAALGRGETTALIAGDIKSSFSLATTGFEPRGEPDRALPAATQVPALAELEDAVRLAARLAIPETFDEHRLIVTLFLFRVIVRAGEQYPGFLHRDIASPSAPVGSVIFYPTVTWQNIEGMEVGVHFSSLPTDHLGQRDPDVTYAPRDYERAAIVLTYPRNLAHGARPGKNPHPSAAATTRTHADDVRQFLDPHETTFCKDMAVLTFTQTSAIEDHVS
jgi:hypothetical protein